MSAGDGAVAAIGRLERRPLYELLAHKLCVSRPSLRQAVVAPKVQGLLEVRHGGGAFLRRDRLQPAPMAEVLDRRQRLPAILDALETAIARPAAQRRTPQDQA